MTDDWLPTARITTPLGYNTTWEEGVAQAVESNANVILDWAGFSDSYRGTVLETANSLEELQYKVDYVHTQYPTIKYMVYIAPLEMITYNSDLNEDGYDDDGMHSTYTDHPEWLQMGIDGRLAVFYGSMEGMPFWVAPTSEDVWISPSNRDYRGFIMDLAQQIAMTGIDAVWFDVPHLSFNFGDNWQDQWCSVDPASRSDFYNDTGWQLPTPPFQPDWHDPIWQQFVIWRYQQIIDFVYDFNVALKSGNSDCKLIIETSSNSVLITQHGCNLIALQDACDAICHEYSGPYVEWQYYSWLHMLATLKFWYDLDKNPSWLLSYVQQGNIPVARFHAALLTAMSYNYYTSGNIGMAGIVDPDFMHTLFSWLERYDDYVYGWSSKNNVALLFSQQTLDFMDKGRWSGYAYHDEFLGTLMMLIESNIPFDVLTDRDIGRCSEYETIILDNVACMSEDQALKLQKFAEDGGTLIVINETSLYTETGDRRDEFLLSDVFGVSVKDVVGNVIYQNRYGNGSCVFTMFPLGRYYIWEAMPWNDYGNGVAAEYWREQFVGFINRGNLPQKFEIEGHAVAIPYEKKGTKMLRLLNFEEIQKGNAAPQTQEVKVIIYEEVEINNVSLLEFMGGFRNVEVLNEDGSTVISFDLYTQSSLIFEEKDENVYTYITQPEEGILYFMGREMMQLPTENAIVLGSVTIVVTSNGNTVKFYVDDELRWLDDEAPFEWIWDETVFGKYTIKTVAYDNAGNSDIDEIDVIIFNIG
jgi:hypothetical protein